MPYVQRLNLSESLTKTDVQQFAIEFNLLRQELDEVRANYNAVLAKLDADVGVTDTNYAATLGVGTTGSSATATAAVPRRFTPT